MDNNYTSLTLNGRHYTPGDLQDASENILKSWSAPGWQKKIYLFIEEWLSPSSLFGITTSGSTGSPKTITVTREQMISSALRTGECFGLKPGDKALLCLPVDFIAGKMMIVRAFVLGLDLVTVHPSSNPLENSDDRFAFAAMTPMQVHHTLERKDGIEKLNRIQKLIIGGGDMDARLEGQLKELSNAVYHTYGMTETLTHVAMRRMSGAGGIREYKALEGVSFSLDQRGCLVITDEVLGITGMATNDLVELLSAKAFRYVGRVDHIINTGGIKVNPEVVESALQAKLGCRIIVAGKKDPVLGEKVVLVAELKGCRKPANLKYVIRSAALEKHQLPREVYWLDSFPESSGGKILRGKLSERIGPMSGEALTGTG